jgi:hypothetical protein
VDRAFPDSVDALSAIADVIAAGLAIDFAGLPAGGSPIIWTLIWTWGQVLVCTLPGRVRSAVLCLVLACGCIQQERGHAEGEYASVTGIDTTEDAVVGIHSGLLGLYGGIAIMVPRCNHLNLQIIS